MTDDEGAPRTLGGRLRELRQAAGLSGTQLAELAGLSQPKISRLETGRQWPTEEELNRIARAIGLSQAEHTALQREAERLSATFVPVRDTGADTFVRTQRSVGGNEQGASLIRHLSLTVVPGLLQTADYARAIFASLEASADLARSVAARLERQTILFRGGRRFVFVVHETALTMRYAEPEVMAAQLDRILHVASLAGVDLRVVPGDILQPRPTMASFSIYDDDLVVEETNWGSVAIRDPAKVGAYLRLFERFLEVASAERTPEIIRRHLAELQAADASR